MFLVAGAVLGFLGVALGAFGAHALRATLSAERQAIWQTAVQYHFHHALALLATGLLIQHGGTGRAAWLAGWAFLGGTVLFSGSLYAVAFFGERRLGAITPVGGLLFLIGWAALAWAGWRLVSR